MLSSRSCSMVDSTMPVAQDEDARTALALMSKLDVIGATPGLDDEVRRQKSQVIIYDLDELDLELDTLADDIATLMTRVYEIQEIRHTPSTTQKLDTKLQALDHSLESLSKRLTTLTDALRAVGPTEADRRDFALRLEAVELAWKDALGEDAVLREELREDRWLVVFRTAAEQADNMVDSLQKAINQCSDFITAVQSGRTSPEYNVSAFKALEKSYAAKKKFYVPSVSKSLSILDKGINERITKNGETLRRHADMKQRWRETTSKLAVLNAQLPLIMLKLQGVQEYVSARMGSQELLTSPGSSSASLPDDRPYTYANNMATPGRSRAYSRVSSSASPSASPQLRRIPSSSAVSAMSSASTSSARPPWNASPKPVDDIGGPANSSTIKAAVKLNQNKRLNSLYSLFGGGGGEGRRASSPGGSSTASTAATESNRPAPPSRLPIPSPSPRRIVSTPAPPPRLSLSSAPPVPPIPQSLKSPINGYDRANAAYLRSNMMTPEPMLRQRATQMPFYTSSRSTPTSTRPSRQSLGGGSRAPPSSYRSTTPTPSRPGSRAGAATPSTERPRSFVPNPIDELDLEVAKLLAAHPGELFVQRTDPPLRANQLRNGQEWKGEFIFGGGKVLQCRLLELAKSGKGGARVRKVMVRIGGVWMELSTYLARL